MTAFSAEQKIGDIVATMPAASDVFKAYDIDFCCGGGRTLSQAIEEQKLDKAEVLGKLDEAYTGIKQGSDAMDFKRMSASELTEYIENRHHTYLKKVLPVISGYIARILEVHGTRHNELFKVHELFSRLRTELEEHLVKEEKILFPMIRLYERKPATIVLDEVTSTLREKEIEAEHERAGAILKEIRKASNGYEVPLDGCNTYRIAYEKLQDLEADLFQHVHLENNILFKALSRDNSETGTNNNKTVDFSKSVRDLIRDDPEITGIMRGLGFESITKPAMLNTAGRFMTIPNGAVMKGIDLGSIREAFIEKGYEIKE